MFRTQQNAFDDAVAKATDENLTSEDWGLILEVCDKVGASPSGGRDVVAAMIRRLLHRNANVQLYTLELANALSQNCGIELHRELASKSFTDALLRRASDKNTHDQVKSKILERMGEWTKMFSKNQELGVMGQAYERLKRQDPNLLPPQAPTKRQITDVDRRKEEEELQMALKLSIQESKTPGQGKPAELAGQATTSGGAGSSSEAHSSTPQPLSSGTTAATVSRVRALYDFVPSEPGELQFRQGDVIAVIDSAFKDWWRGSLRGQTGIFPLNYVEKLTDPTPEDLRREAQMEAEVFGQIKNVERLLALLSTNTGDARDNDEVTDLYNSTLAIRPKLIELIGKYTQKKDDFQQLNEKFIKARRDYEALLESSMAHSAQQYGRPGAQPYGYGGGPPPQGYPPQQRYYTNDGQPSNSGAPPPQGPPSQYPPSNTQSFQPPYPVSTPVPQSHTPVPPGHGQAAGYPPQPPTGGRRQSYHSDHQAHIPNPYPPQQPQEMGTSAYDSPTDGPSHRQSYPNPAVSNVQGASGNDYYTPSVYSVDSQYPPSEHQQPPSSQYPPPVHAQIPPVQQQNTGYAPQQSAYPPQSQQQSSHAPSAPPPDQQSAASPYPGYPGPSQQPPPQPTYQAYQPPQVAGSGPPQNFYR